AVEGGVLSVPLVESITAPNPYEIKRSIIAGMRCGGATQNRILVAGNIAGHRVFRSKFEMVGQFFQLIGQLVQ
ncbi:hypothetical protein QQ73_08255, partial [Candidatus Endoriftia persephone str. Guaymas]|nr:hypothetical protein [Candidatus Endoriftia persephone str. Guaymas]